MPAHLDVTYALAPYAASGSASTVGLKGSWQGKLSAGERASPAAPNKRRLFVAAVAVTALVALSAFVVPGLLNRSADGQPKQSTPIEVEPNVLTVSQSASDGGQFRSINAALAVIKPRMKLLVLDDAEYDEVIYLASRSQFEGVTLESPKGATIASKEAVPIKIDGVPNAGIKGFRIRAEGQKQTLVMVRGRCAGLSIDGLELLRVGAADFDGIALTDIPLEPRDSPVVVQNCVIRGPQNGMILMGKNVATNAPQVCSRIAIRNNRIIAANKGGMRLFSRLHQVQITGNVFEEGAEYGALQFEELNQVEDLLIANNTFFQPSGGAIRIADTGANGKRVGIRNNLVLATGDPDMATVPAGMLAALLSSPPDPKKLLEAWQFSHNWREAKERKAGGGAPPGWIPPSTTDVLQLPIEVVSRDPTDPDFLRPLADSRLATEGAGNEIAELPKYIGARPPHGAPPHDWERTWTGQDTGSVRP